ncbi:MAG: acyltransferase family protein [Leptospira sp.]|nr:acyltransferase family protein [Leptospira sp.]
MGRLLYLDNLRSFALLLGIVFHAAIVYAPKISYAIQNLNRAEPFGYFSFWVHSFRMPLFFIISGYFSVLVWEKKGKESYIEGRIKRILIPMIIGLIFFAPIQYYLVAKLKYTNVLVVPFVSDFFTIKNFSHSHIWFLVDLFLFSLIFIVIPKSIFKFIAKNLPDNTFLQSFIFILIPFIFTTLAHSFFPRGDDYIGVDKLTFMYQCGFFFVGILAYFKRSILISEIIKSKLEGSILLILGILIFILFYQLEISDPLWMPYYYGNQIIRLTHVFLWSMSPLVWTYFFVFLFQKIANVTNPFTVYLVDSSLPIYLLHHPISLGIAYFIRNIDISPYYKFGIHVSLVLVLSFLIYDTFIKNTIILRTLFGLK